MTQKDKAALKLAMEHARREAGRGEQLDSMLNGTRLQEGKGWACPPEPWERVAQFAASCVQSRSLRLKPWESPPCQADVDGGGHDAELLRKMLAAGVSTWHPDPIAALEEAAR